MLHVRIQEYVQMNEELLKKIKEIVEGERLAMDSYFFCGSGSSLPDDELVSAGDAFLKAAAEGNTDEAAKAKLIERLEAAAAKGQEMLKSRIAIIDEAEDPKKAVIREILAELTK